jgi:hypothetical protein
VEQPAHETAQDHRQDHNGELLEDLARAATEARPGGLQANEDDEDAERAFEAHLCGMTQLAFQHQPERSTDQDAKRVKNSAESNHLEFFARKVSEAP